MTASQAIVTRIPPTDDEACAIIRTTHFQYEFFPSPIGQSNHAGEIMRAGEARENRREDERHDKDWASVRELRSRLEDHVAVGSYARNAVEVAARAARTKALGRVIEVLDGLMGELRALGSEMEWAQWGPYEEEGEEERDEEEEEEEEEDEGEDDDEEDDGAEEDEDDDEQAGAEIKEKSGN
ncbi:MAG: hypothetical protein Q9207_008441 [Kuettlingeria erythrocarpa]